MYLNVLCMQFNTQHHTCLAGTQYTKYATQVVTVVLSYTDAYIPSPRDKIGSIINVRI